MAHLIYKIKAYAKSKGVNDIDFTSDVIVVTPSDEDSKIQTWNLDISKPTIDELNSFEDEANTMKEEDDAKPTRADLQASAKLKLMNGETLTEDEANIMVGL
jgi:hypothetical protein